MSQYDKEPRRLVFMGSPQFAIPALHRLLAGPYGVVAVYTQPDRSAGRGRTPTPPPVKQVALEHGLPVVQPARLRDPGEVERLRAFRPEIVVVAAFGQILPPAVLVLPPSGCLNIHPSLLPRHRGAAPIPAAILAGDEETGVSIMLLDAGLDSGPVLAQRRLLVAPEDTTATLTPRLADIGADLLLETLPRWLAGEISPVAQDEAQATYAPQLLREAAEINWRLPAEELWRQVRAFDPWPGSHTTWQDKRLKVLEAFPLPEADDTTPGLVVALPGGGDAVVRVGTGKGMLVLRRVQIEGKRPVTAAEFVRGQRGFVSSILGDRGISDAGA